MIYPAKSRKKSHDRIREGKERSPIDKNQLLERICKAAEDDNNAYT